LKQSTGFNQSTPSLQGSTVGLRAQIGIKHVLVYCSDSCRCVTCLWQVSSLHNLPWASVWPIRQRSPSILKQSTGFQAVHSFLARFSTGLAAPNWDQTFFSTLLQLNLTGDSPWASAWPIRQRTPSISEQCTGFQTFHSFFAKFSPGLTGSTWDQTCSSTLL
jgi:hypothetical protein